MKMTVGEVLQKINNIDGKILYVQLQLPDNYFAGQEPLCGVIELLEEYKELLTAAKTEIDL